MRKIIIILGTVAALVLLASPASASPVTHHRKTWATCTGHNGIISGHVIMWQYSAWQPCTPVCHRHHHGKRCKHHPRRDHG